MGKGKKVRAAEAAHRESDISLEALLGDVFSDEPAPEGYLTRRQWAEVWRVSQCQAKRHISKIVAAGKMQMRWCRQMDVTGRAYRVPIYGIIKKEK